MPWHEQQKHRVGDRHLIGRDAIRRLNSQRAAGPSREVHILSEPAIEVHGDAADVRTSFIYVTAGRDGYRIELAGLYADRFTRDETGTWRCRARATTHLSTAEASGRPAGSEG